MYEQLYHDQDYFDWLRSPRRKLRQHGRVVCRKRPLPVETAVRVRLYGRGEAEVGPMDDLWIPGRGVVITEDVAFAAGARPPEGVRVLWTEAAKELLVEGIDNQIEDYMRSEIPELLPEAQPDPAAVQVAKASFLTGLDHARMHYTLEMDPAWSTMNWKDYVSFYTAGDEYVRRMAEKWLGPDDNFAHAVKIRLCELQADGIMQVVQENPADPWHQLRQLWQASGRAGKTLLVTVAGPGGEEKVQRIKTERFRLRLLGWKGGFEPEAVTQLQFGGRTLFRAHERPAFSCGKDAAAEAEDPVQAVLDVCKAGTSAGTPWLRRTLAKLADALLSRCAAQTASDRDFGSIYFAAADAFHDTGCIRDLREYMQ